MVELWATTALTQICVMRSMFVLAWKRLPSITSSMFLLLLPLEIFTWRKRRVNEMIKPRAELNLSTLRALTVATTVDPSNRNWKWKPLVRKMTAIRLNWLLCIYCLLSPQRTSEQFHFGVFRWNTRRILSWFNVPCIFNDVPVTSINNCYACVRTLNAFSTWPHIFSKPTRHKSRFQLSRIIFFVVSRSFFCWQNQFGTVFRCNYGVCV